LQRKSWVIGGGASTQDQERNVGGVSERKNVLKKAAESQEGGIEKETEAKVVLKIKALFAEGGLEEPSKKSSAALVKAPDEGGTGFGKGEETKKESPRAHL